MLLGLLLLCYALRRLIQRRLSGIMLLLAAMASLESGLSTRCFPTPQTASSTPRSRSIRPSGPSRDRRDWDVTTAMPLQQKATPHLLILPASLSISSAEA